MACSGACGTLCGSNWQRSRAGSRPRHAVAGFRPTLLARRVRLYVDQVAGKPKTKLDVPNTLTFAAFVTKCVPGALSDGLALPLTHCPHDGDYQPSRRPEPVSNDSATEINATVAMARIFASCASSETPCSACRSVDTRT